MLMQVSDRIVTRSSPYCPSVPSARHSASRQHSDDSRGQRCQHGLACGDDGAITSDSVDCTPLFPPEVLACNFGGYYGGDGCSGSSPLETHSRHGDQLAGSHDGGRDRVAEEWNGTTGHSDWSPRASPLIDSAAWDSKPPSAAARRSRQRTRSSGASSKRRGRNPTTTNIFIPTETGRLLALDHAVDSLVDSFLPLSTPLITQQCLHDDGADTAGNDADAFARDSTPPLLVAQGANANNINNNYDNNYDDDDDEAIHNCTGGLLQQRAATDPDSVQLLRRIKNSNSARRSRMRKAIRLQALEMAVHRLEERVSALQAENGDLRDQLVQARCNA